MEKNLSMKKAMMNCESGSAAKTHGFLLSNYHNYGWKKYGKAEYATILQDFKVRAERYIQKKINFNLYDTYFRTSYKS